MLLALACLPTVASVSRFAAAHLASDDSQRRGAWRWLVAAALAAAGHTLGT